MLGQLPLGQLESVVCGAIRLSDLRRRSQRQLSWFGVWGASSVQRQEFPLNSRSKRPLAGRNYTQKGLGHGLVAGKFAL